MLGRRRSGTQAALGKALHELHLVAQELAPQVYKDLIQREIAILQTDSGDDEDSKTETDEGLAVPQIAPDDQNDLPPI